MRFLFFSPNSRFSSPTTSRWWIALIAALFVLSAAPFIAVPTVGGSSEARELHIAQLMVSTGNWINPSRNGLVASKPPLYHWVSAGIAALTDMAVTPAIGRLVSLLFAAGTLALLMALLLSLHPEQSSERMRTLSLFGVVVLSTCYGFANMAVTAMVDMCFSFWVTLACYALLRRMGAGVPIFELRSADYTLFFIASGLATLAKGPLGLVLPAVIVFSCFVLRLGLRSAIVQCFTPRVGWGIYAIIASSWYLLVALSGGDDLLDRQLIFENVERLLGAENIPGGPPWFYLGTMVRNASPWALLLLLTFLAVPIRSAAVGVGRAWFFAGLLLFSVAAGKRNSYLLPLFPGLALAVAAFWYDKSVLFPVRLQIVGRWLLRNLSWIVAALCLFGAGLVAALLYVPISDNVRFSVIRSSFEGAGWFSMVLLIMAALLSAVVRLRPGLQAMRGVVNFFCFNLFIFAAMLHGEGAKAALKGYDQIALQIAAVVPKSATLGAVRIRFDEFFDPIFYYLGRPVRLQDPEAPLAPDLEFLLAKRSWVNTKPAADGWHEVARFQSPADIGRERPEREVVLLAHLPP